MTLSLGMKAPAFSASASHGDTTALTDFLARKNVVLYFYPKDDTPGCTLEAKAFQDLLAEYERQDAVILGVSKDTLESHNKFRDKYGLRFHLLSDPNAVIAQAYGVYVEKSMFGKKYFGLERATFLINKEGYIAQLWRKVKVKGHAQAVLVALQEYNQSKP